MALLLMAQLLFIGLGRIGLPQSLVFANQGFQVLGYDHDSHLQQNLQKKIVPFYEPMLDEYLNKTLDKTFHPLDKWENVVAQLPKVDAIFFTLGTNAPDSRACLEENTLNLSTIQTMLTKIFDVSFKKGVVLIFRTTLPLGSTDQLKNWIEERYSLIENLDFHLAFVPERLMEGQAIAEEEGLPKIIGTYNDAAFSIIEKIFKTLGGKIIRVANPKTAEFCKLTDNSFRNTLFAFANEIAMHAGENSIDVNEVIDAVNTDYARNTIQQPGFVSGYCLGKDPYIFEYGFNQMVPIRNDFCSLWYYGRRTNDYMLDYVTHKMTQKIKNIADPVVTILGLSFKEDIDDFRMSHAIAMMQKLIEKGVTRFKVFDPNLDKNKYTLLPDNIAQHVIYKSQKLDKNLFTQSHATLIAHRPDNIIHANNTHKLKELISSMEKPAYVFDAWNVWRNAHQLPNIDYEALGWGIS